MASKYDQSSTGTQLVADLSDHIKGKTILVTGVSPGGLGASFAEKIAKAKPSTLVIAGRNASKTQQTADAITAASPDVTVRTLDLDLGSFASVRRAAETVNGWSDVPHIDVLVNNAGIMGVEYGVTEDGFERQWGTNHLGPFLFTNLIIDKVLASKSPRIIIVSSNGHRMSAIRWADHGFKDGEIYRRWTAYGQSKTANLLMAKYLAEKLGPRGLQCYSLHPGAINTNLGAHIDWESSDDTLKDADAQMGNKYMWSDLQFKNIDEGTATHVYTAFAPGLEEHNGAYFQDCRLADQYEDEVFPWATDRVEADRLWQVSEKLVGQKFAY